MSYLEALDGAEQFERHASDLSGVVWAVLLRQTRDHHVSVSNSLHLNIQLHTRWNNQNAWLTVMQFKKKLLVEIR